MLITACSNNDNKDESTIDEVSTDSSSSIELIISKDFGREIILNETVEFEKYWTVLDALDSKVEIATDQGGGFISAINGHESHSKGGSANRLDWFYYVNGICADVGALDYDLNDGDVVWWDYHEWKSMDATNSTVVGLYPEPFVHGYRGKVSPTTIMCSEKNKKLANTLLETLVEEGVETIGISQIENSIIENREGPLIVIGEWKELSEFEYIKKLNEAYERNGTYIHYDENNLELMDSGNEKKLYLHEVSGSIMSHGDGLGDENPLWIISGTDTIGLEKAIKLLIENSDNIYGTYSIAIEDNETFSLPLE